MRIRIGAVVAAICLLAALPASQSPQGVLDGTITDVDSRPLPGATVAIAGLERRSMVTDERGEYRFVNLAPGKYEIRASLPGFATVATSATVADARTTTVHISLRVGSLEETITVSAETPAADATKAIPSSRSAGGVAAGVSGGMIGGANRREMSPRPGAPAPHLPGRYSGPFNTEAYDHVTENGVRRVENDPLSTFSIDVDTASYANVRRFLTDGQLPPAGAVRVEELINYFRFAYPQPAARSPFSVTTELAECPWNPDHQLALIGIQGRELNGRDPAPRNLVFLLDVSGSMTSADKLPLVRQAMLMLVDVLSPRDRVAIVVYAGASGLVLPSTPGSRKEVIKHAIARLEAGGSTNGAAGIQLAYRTAREHFIAGGVNRVILATDGDFNVGVTSQSELIRLIERERASGVFLSVLGVGTGNLKDSTMEKLADSGNGNYAYLDSLYEARKVLVREAGATLTTIAKDVKIQVEFNPRVVAAYRLIGYENRALRDEDFNDDAKDAGEIGAGHSVTALYEIIPVGVEVDSPIVDPLRYQRQAGTTRAANSSELAMVKVRYKAPHGDTSELVSSVLGANPRAMSRNLGFASAVAEFGMLLVDSPHRGRATYASAAARARQFAGEDAEGYRAQFVKLVETAARLDDYRHGADHPRGSERQHSSRD
jgi:Ca-activated chloride channel family protein